MHAIVRLAATTGARRGEILGLKWLDVDRDPPVLRFRRTVAEGENGLVVKRGLKTSTSKVLDIDADTLAALDHLPTPHSGYLFSDDKGATPWHPSRLTKSYRRWQRKLEIDSGRFHDLRHLHASVLLSQGHPVNAVAARLGHASPTVTLSVYAHVLPGQDQVAASIAGEAFPLPTS
jgi:integrase